MKHALQALSPTHKSTGKVVDGKLILSFPGALRPVVWQMDFAHVKASALEVQEKENIFALVLKTPKGENVEIAPFDTKDEAVKGLLVASKALEGAQGKIRLTAPATAGTSQPQPMAGTPAEDKKSGGWIAPVLGVLMLVILLFIWGTMSPQVPASLSSADGTTAGTNTDAVGVPLSADDFLNAQ